MKTPTTSIQFLWPGKMDDKMVFWGIRKNTTRVLIIMLNVLPEISCNEYTKHTHVAADANVWTETCKISKESPGQTGDSTMKVSVTLQTKQSEKDQNKDLHLSSCKHSYFLNKAPIKESVTPQKPAETTPASMTYFCGIGCRNITVLFSLGLALAIPAGWCALPSESKQQNCHIAQLSCKSCSKWTEAESASSLSKQNCFIPMCPVLCLIFTHGENDFVEIFCLQKTQLLYLETAVATEIAAHWGIHCWCFASIIPGLKDKYGSPKAQHGKQYSFAAEPLLSTQPVNKQSRQQM